MVLKGALTSISLAIAATLLPTLIHSSPVLSSREANTTSYRNNGLQDLVQWDSYSLVVNGERVFLFSGEFHYFRLPSPDLWKDVLQKFKALEFNGVSFYFNWGYHSAKKGVYDFTGVRDIQKAFAAAEEAGLHVISRAGPYINAEIDSGGFPGWLGTMYSMARKSSPENDANSREWLNEIDKYLVPNQITEGGNIILNQIDNEYATNIDPYYHEMIKTKFAEDGIVVPSIYNDPWTSGRFVSGVGSVDIYGWDSYPVLFDCSNPEIWPANASTYWRAFHESNNPTEPMALYEFQGGSYDSWGGPGYEKCRRLVNERFAKVFYKNNYAQGATIQNLYMVYGGTSWGNSAGAGTYTSYDYAGAITEAGLLTPKAYELKLQGKSYVNPHEGLECRRVPSSPPSTILVDGLASIDTHAKFYIAQHRNTPSNELDSFHITVETTDGTFVVPRSRKSKLVLNGRDAKILVADYDFESQHLVYATSEIFTHQSFESYDVLIVYAYEQEDGELALKLKNKDHHQVKVSSSAKGVSSSVKNSIVQINYKHPNGTISIYVSSSGDDGDGNTKDLLILVAGYESAATRWWAPTVKDTASDRVLIQGPYLVREASIEGSTVHFLGDIDEDTPIQVVVPDYVKAFTWNGKAIHLRKGKHAIWTGLLKFTAPKNLLLPDLRKLDWKYSPASPETHPDFDDSSWIVANHLQTNSVTVPSSWPILYADDYGFHCGNIWYRGKFNGSSAITGFNLTALSSTASGWVAWLNGEYLGGYDVGNHAFENPKGLKTEGENTLSLLLWTAGHTGDWNANDEFKIATGFTLATLLGIGNQSIWDIQWKIQGNLGGEDLADPARGPYNEGGLYGERFGWHLPGFDDRAWKVVSPQKNRTGLAWYRTSFDVHVPDGYDVPLAINIKDETNTRYRALIFINGWQFGRYVNDIGPQTQFYLPAGILNTKGTNTLAIAVVPFDKGAQLGEVTLEPVGVLQSAMPAVSLVDSPGYDARRTY
ncbi:glycoside hydrolase superfamily [Dichotomocladium elegans]|nr:glycoside hydrolase superfamily [Dichotomocladium elegans]